MPRNNSPHFRRRTTHPTVNERTTHGSQAFSAVPTFNEETIPQTVIDSTYGQQNLMPGAVTAGSLAAKSVIAEKMDVPGYGSGSKLADGMFDWIGSGDTRYWTLAAEWSVSAASVGALYARGRFRLRGQPTGAATRYAMNEQKINVIPEGVYAVAIEHAIEGMTAGDLTLQILEYDSSDVSLVTSDVMRWTASQGLSAEGAIIAGSTAKVPDGTHVGLYLHADTAYVRVRLRMGSTAVASNWWITAVAFSQGAVAQMGGSPVDLYGGVHIDGGGIIIYDGKIIFRDSYGTTALDGLGFGATWRRFLATGLFNSDFFAAPPTPGSNLDNSTNALPYWSFTQSSGTAITAKSVVDTGQASGRAIEFAMAAGAAGDTSYIQQISPVSGSHARAQAHYVLAEVQVDAGATTGHDWFVEVEYLKSDFTSAATAVTSAVSCDGHINGGTYQLSVTPADVVPAVAYYLRVRVGMRRDTATTGSTEVGLSLYDVRIMTGHPRVVISGDEKTLGPLLVTPVAASYFRQEGSEISLQMPEATKFTSQHPYTFPNNPVTDKPSANYTVTNVTADVTGVSIAFTPSTAEYAIVDFSADVAVTVAGPGAIQVELDVNGTSEAEFAVFEAGAGATGRANISQHYVISLTGGVSYTFKLRAKKANAGGTAVITSTHTVLRVLRIGR